MFAWPHFLVTHTHTHITICFPFPPPTHSPLTPLSSVWTAAAWSWNPEVWISSLRFVRTKQSTWKNTLSKECTFLCSVSIWSDIYTILLYTIAYHGSQVKCGVLWNMTTTSSKQVTTHILTLIINVTIYSFLFPLFCLTALDLYQFTSA